MLRRRPSISDWPASPQERQDARNARTARVMEEVRAAAKPSVSYGGEIVATVIPKFAYIRSPALLRACREIPCQHCGRADGTVVAAHSNQAAHGKGRGIKASDQFVAGLCAWCHAALDQGNVMSRTERLALWTAAHVKTVALLLRLNLWPAGVPIPLSQLETQ
jgi:hypothetical protein